MTDLRVGFGVGAITPDVPVFLAGFAARTEAAAGVRDELEAHAVLIQRGGARLVLVVCDLLGMSPDVATDVRAAIGDALDLPLQRVLTACTHTHTGPSVLRGGERLGWPTPEGYETRVADGCVAAARAALASSEPGELFFARRPLPAGVSVNRRSLPYDPTFAVLDARRPDGTSIGTLANVGVHPVALGPQCLEVSTDWVGPFRRALAERTGGAAALLQGALGDVNPTDPHAHDDHGDYHHAEHIGTAIAAAVEDVRGDLAPVTGAIGRAVRRTIAAPVGITPLTALVEVTGGLDVEFVEWELGSVRVVSVPGEAFHAFGNDVMAHRTGGALLAGLAPAWQGYLPSPWGEGYEETVSYGEPFVAAVRDALRTDPLA
jgi:hypothetical protein